MSCALDSDGELALMSCAGTGNTSGDDLSSLRQDLAAVLTDGLVIDVLDFINTESADFSAGLSATGISFHESRLLSAKLRNQIRTGDHRRRYPVLQNR